MILAEDLHKSFDGVEVLRGVSLRVEKGEILALIGQSGGGKSVFLRHLAGLMRPDRGRVVIDGNDLCCLSGKELRRLRSRFGFLFQSGALFDSMSVFDNVAFPLQEKTRMSSEEIRHRVFAELEKVGLVGSEDKLPAQISGGMIKRAALARALARGPEIMLFDEPTTGLDPVIVHSIHDLIQSSHQRLGFTGVIVTHEVPCIFQIVQKVALLHQGVIQLVGTPEEVLTSKDPVVRDFLSGCVPPGQSQMLELELQRFLQRTRRNS